MVIAPSPRGAARLAWLMLLLPGLVSAATWYWRPNTTTYGKQTGASYADAWSTDQQIDWAAMKDGDRLLVCGRHDTGYLDRELATGRPRITISGDCPGDPGEIVSVGGLLTPDKWSGPDRNGVYTAAYSGSPSVAIDEIGRLKLLSAVPTAASPCRSYYHENGVFFYRPCGPPMSVRGGGGSPVIDIRHDGVTLEHLSIRNGGLGVRVQGASGVTLRHLHIREQSGLGILLAGGTADGKVQFSEIHDVTDGILAIARPVALPEERHDRWLIEGNFIHDVSGSGDSHAIGWQSGSDNVYRRNYILRAAGSGITIYAWRDRENSRNLIEDNVIVDVVRKSNESNQRGIELSSDACLSSLENRRGDVIRNNVIENVAEGIYAKAGPTVGGNVGVVIENNRIRARDIGIMWANPNGGMAPDFPMWGNVIEAPRRLKPLHSKGGGCS